MCSNVMCFVVNVINSDIFSYFFPLRSCRGQCIFFKYFFFFFLQEMLWKRSEYIFLYPKSIAKFIIFQLKCEYISVLRELWVLPSRACKCCENDRPKLCSLPLRPCLSSLKWQEFLVITYATRIWTASLLSCIWAWNLTLEANHDAIPSH